MKKYLLSFIIFGLLFVSQSFAMDSKEVTVMPPANKAEYKKCPDGTMINPGEKCPEKAKAEYIECPDGTMINRGEKCPEKASRAKKGNKKDKAQYRECPDGTMISAGEKCPEKADRNERAQAAQEEACAKAEAKGEKGKKGVKDKDKKETHRGHVTCLK